MEGKLEHVMRKMDDLNLLNDEIMELYLSHRILGELVGNHSWLESKLKSHPGCCLVSTVHSPRELFDNQLVPRVYEPTRNIPVGHFAIIIKTQELVTMAIAEISDPFAKQNLAKLTPHLVSKLEAILSGYQLDLTSRNNKICDVYVDRVVAHGKALGYETCVMRNGDLTEVEGTKKKGDRVIKTDLCALVLLYGG